MCKNIIMMNIKIVVIIIAVNVIRAESGTPRHRLTTIDGEYKHGDSEDTLATTVLGQIPPTMKIYLLNGEKSRPAETRLGPLDDYESIEYEESDNGHTSRFADIQDDALSGDDRSANQYQNDSEPGSFEDKTIEELNEKTREDAIKEDYTKRQMTMNRVMLDNKARSAAIDANEEDFEMHDVTTFDQPRLGNPRPCHSTGNICSAILYAPRHGYISPHFTTIPRPELFHRSFYTVHNPHVFQASPQLTRPINRSPIEDKVTLPFVNTNSYPYERPLTNIDEPQQKDSKLNILKKLMEATNSALTSDNPFPYFEPNNMYPQYQ